MNGQLTMSKGNRVECLDVLRVYALVTLVLFHVWCVYIGWGAFMPELLEQTKGSPVVLLYKLIANALIPAANMPLFTAISGFVFAYLYNELGKYRAFLPFVKNKARRLLLPYVVFGVLNVLTVYDSPGLSSLYTGAPHHLWYCLFLFWSFMIIALYVRGNRVVKGLIAVATIGVQLTHPFVPYWALNFVVELFGYFLFGYYLPQIVAFFYRFKKSWLLLSVLYVAMCVLALRINGYYLLVARCYLYVTLLFVLCHRLTLTTRGGG